MEIGLSLPFDTLEVAMRIIQCISFLFVLWSFDLVAQVTANTTSGQHIILVDDGVWVKNDELETESSAIDFKNSPFKENIALLLEVAEERERLAFGNNYRTELNISKCMTAISKIQSEGNQEKMEQLKSIYKKLTEQQKKDAKEYTTISKMVDQIKQIPSYSVKKQREMILVTANELDVEIQAEMKESNATAAENKNVRKVEDKVEIADCRYAILDGSKEKRHIELSSIPIFTYTSSQLKQYFKERELMDTHVSLVQKDKRIYLRLTVHIISRDAAKNYGYIPKGSMLRFRLINNTNVNLYAEEDIRFEIENYTGNAIYSGLFPVMSEDLDLLRRMPIDSLGIMWSSGFEMYDIYNVDAVMQLFNCLQSIQ